ncbi:hypothetical protein I4U23_017047 [Adineta vaga]|nr:hypothetical protein I4U23_017047 [Adineta vaga]
MPEENIYDNESQDRTSVLKHQKYSTWLYVLCLIVSFYVLFYIAMVNPQDRTIVITDLTPDIFTKLDLKHGKKLSCPCLTISIPYQTVASNTIELHPVCSSHFVSQQWIQSLYISDASRYGVVDFRTTASSQFQLLSSFCSLSQDIALQIQTDIDNLDFVSDYLLPEVDFQLKINAISDSVNTRANHLVSALNTNTIIRIKKKNDQYTTVGHRTLCLDTTLGVWDGCGSTNKTVSAVFDLLTIKQLSSQPHVFCPLDGFLRSTLDCLYDIQCLELLMEYFPSLNKTHFNATDSNDFPSIEILVSWKMKIRAYLFCISFVVFGVFNSLNEEMATISVANPSIISYETLHISYPSTLKCSCSTKAIPYTNFLSLSPTIHQVCSSDFVDKRWISWLMQGQNQWTLFDWRNTGPSQFELLSELCQLANKTINEVVDRFLSQSFIVSNLLTANDFDAQLDVILDQFLNSSTVSFGLLIDIVRLLMQVDQPYMSLSAQSLMSSVTGFDSNLITNIVANNTSKQQSLKFTFALKQTDDVYSASSSCVFATNPHFRQKCSDRVRAIIRNVTALIYTQLTDLNIFPRRDFGSHIDEQNAKRLGQWSTRLYIVLLITSVSVFAIYTIIQPQTVTKTSDTPSLITYNALIEKYGDQLQCSCGSIVSEYTKFMEIEPVFHQICLSPFISDQWRVNLTSNLVSNLSVYARTDYRRFLSAHLQFLRGLCQVSMESVNNSIDQLLTSSFITTQLLSQISFDRRLNSSIEHRKSQSSTTLSQILVLIRSINHGNAIISTYGTNFEYIALRDVPNDSYAPTQAFIYGDGCSCGLYSNCTSQAKFIEKNASESNVIKGLKIGCIPSEAFLVSTLECFYNSSCIQLIQQYTNSTNHINPLSTGLSRFPVQTTIAQLIDNLFTERWIAIMNYSLYFERCSPLLCSYTYIQKFNPLYTITAILGFQGGLTIILQWICPKLVRLIVKIFQYLSTATRSPIVTNTTDTTTTQTIISKPCPLKFKSMSLYESTTDVQATSPVLADFNGDKQIDLVFYSARKNNIHVLLRNGEGDFGKELTMSIGYLSSPIRIIVADFNNDNKFDLAFTNHRESKIGILYGHGNGSFQAVISLSIISSNPIVLLFDNPVDITTADFNNDSYLDIIGVLDSPVSPEFHLFLGDKNGNFSSQRFLMSKGKIRDFKTLIDHADFNNDGHIDIIISGPDELSIVVFLGYGNGSFGQLKLSFTGKEIINDIVFGDFNSDTLLDMGVSSTESNDVLIMFGYGNGAFIRCAKFDIGQATNPFIIAVNDFNCDGHSDIVLSQSDPFRISVLVGNETGSFYIQTIFSSELKSNNIWIGVDDFNGDHYQDIIALDQSSGAIYAPDAYLEGEDVGVRSSAMMRVSVFILHQMSRKQRIIRLKM